MKLWSVINAAGLLLGAAAVSAPNTGHGAGGAPSDGIYAYDPIDVRPPQTSAPPGVVATPPSPTGYVADDKHPLRGGDQVSFQILEDRDPPVSLVVTDSGELDVPYVGRVPSQGKTCKQLATELKELLEKDFYYRATVVIGLNAASKSRGRVYVWGEVRRQGPVEIPADEQFTVGKAIMQAGGFADFANKRKVKLVRKGSNGGKETIEVDLVEILEKGKTDQDPEVREDDFVIVPSRLINF